MNFDSQCASIVYTSVDDGLDSARLASAAVVRRALRIEEGRPCPRIALVRGLKTELRRKEREAAAAPKGRA
jgi:hypothetical protein